jgi:lysophospholipase L1-like esterase
VAWPALLERELGARLGRLVWVANAGKSGRTTLDHALQLAHLLYQEPRFERVVLLTGVNDLCAWLGAGAAPGGAEDLERAFDVVPRALARGPWWRRTALFGLLDGLQERWAAPPRAQDEAARAYASWRGHRRGAARWLEELPDPSAALAGFRADLAAIAASCAAREVELVLVTQPALWRSDLAAELEALLWLGGVGDFQRTAGCDYYTAGALAQGLALFNAELASSGRALGVPVLDLAAFLDGDPRCFYDDVHFNEEGARRVAAFLAEGLAALERD